MIYTKNKQNLIGLLSLVMIITISCERDLSDDVVDATFPNTADIFTDNPVSLTDAFFVSFDPNGGANTQGFGTDDNVAYEGTTSIRIDVPAPNDPDGNFIGGIFKDRGNGRNLTQYDALTFWAKGTVNGTVTVGFGTDFETDTYPVSTKVQMTTGWKKYIVPIPDASKLVQEKGMFLFSAGGFDVQGDGPNGNEVAWTFWIDELRFETLGNNFVVASNILNGQDLVVNAFTGTLLSINSLSQVVNLANGQNVTTTVSPNYYNFITSDPAIATVNRLGNINVVGTSGTVTISATLGNDAAQGSYVITSNGRFPLANDPTLPQSSVLSVFSDVYTSVATPNFTPGFGGSTTIATTNSINGNNFVTYRNNNFTGIMWDNSPFSASAMNFLHVDIFVENASTSIEFQIRDIGANQMIETNVSNGQPIGDDADYRFTATGLTAGAWNPINIPLTGNLSSQRNNLGAIILAGGPNFTLDNIYFY